MPDTQEAPCGWRSIGEGSVEVRAVVYRRQLPSMEGFSRELYSLMLASENEKLAHVVRDQKGKIAFAYIIDLEAPVEVQEYLETRLSKAAYDLRVTGRRSIDDLTVLALERAKKKAQEEN